MCVQSAFEELKVAQPNNGLPCQGAYLAPLGVTCFDDCKCCCCCCWRSSRKHFPGRPRKGLSRVGFVGWFQPGSVAKGCNLISL